VCNLYSITTNQAAIASLFRRMNRYVGNLPPMPGGFPDYPAPVIRNVGDAEEIILMRWGMPPPRRAARQSPIFATRRRREPLGGRWCGFGRWAREDGQTVAAAWTPDADSA
jgi:putative SOS response-associated peptidase YedK